LGVQWAGVTEFAQARFLDNLANLSGGDIFKFGGDGGDFLVKQAQDFVLVGDGTSSHVADETSVALSGFSIGQDSESSIGFTFGVSGPLATGKDGAENETLEEGNTSKKAKCGYGAGAKGGCSNCDSAKNNGGLSNAGHSHEGKGSNKHRVHAKKINKICIFKLKKLKIVTLLFRIYFHISFSMQ
jgi:hypothetical protein